MSSNTKQLGRESRILSIGSHVPEAILTNRELEQRVETTDEWIVTRTGIKERRIAEPGTSASELALPAALKALDRAGVDPSELDGILVATVTGDHSFPSTSCLLQAKLGAKNSFCFDISAACSGFLYGCETARAFIASGQAEVILVIGVEVLSSITNYEDRGTCVLFGDGAGAAVVKAGNIGHEVLASQLGADGSHAGLIERPAGGTKLPITAEILDAGLHFLQMKGNEVFKLGVRGMAEACNHVLDKAGFGPEDIDLLVPHQANLRIIEAIGHRLEVDSEKVFVNIDKYGNTSAASVPIALDEAIEHGRLQKGDLLLMVVFGGGLTWGATLVRW